MIRLHLEGGQAQAFHGEAVGIGRAPTNQVIVDHERVSASHALIVPVDGGWVVADRGSKNGTSLIRGDSEPSPVKGDRPVPICTGDILRLGGERGARIRIEIVAEEERHTVAASQVPDARGDAAARAAEDASAARDLLALSDRLQATDTRDDAVDALVAWAESAVVGAQRVGVSLRVDDSLTAVRGAPSRTLAERALSEGRALLLFARDLRGIQSAADRPQIIVAPLGGLGVLEIGAGRESSLSPRDLDVVTVAARYAGLALQQLDLVDRLRATERGLRRENRVLRLRHGAPMVESASPAFERMLAELSRVAPTRTTVLLEGETGVGKEVLSRFIHERSDRADKPFVPINCGALSPALLEAELFGHRKGAFTGAEHDRAGVFEVASGGTVFLDEVGEMSPPLQVALLRTLEESAIRPVGEALERKVDVRIIAATNRDLRVMVTEGRFRADLYYRLRVFFVRVPPLRERKEDIGPLTRAAVERFATELGRPVPRVSDEILALFASYAWPGNVRELMNELERALVRMDPGAEALSADDLSPELIAQPTLSETGAEAHDLRAQLLRVEREILTSTLARFGGHRARAASALGLTRQGLAKKLERLGLSETSASTGKRGQVPSEEDPEG
jgi:Nif-specific regulatory protein